MKVEPARLVDELELPAEGVVYVAASMNELGYGPDRTVDLLERIVSRVLPGGTLVMPSYPFRNDVGRPPEGKVIDVARSPSGMGLLSEVFRRRDGTTRSEHFWLPCSAAGVQAAELLEGQIGVLDPFGAGATLRRMIDADARIVGLGVSLNYNFVVHLADQVLAERYPFQIVATEPIVGQVRCWDGVIRTSRSLFINQQWRKAFRPSVLLHHSPLLRNSLRFFDYQGAWSWSLSGRIAFEEAIRLGTEALNEGKLPPWLTAPA